MCQECGCGKPGPTRIDGQPAQSISSPLIVAAPSHGHGPEHEHTHAHEPEHEHDHPHRHAHDSLAPEHGHAHNHDEGHRTLELNRPVLEANDRQAERNRGFFRALGVLVLNIMSSPGSGKTELVRQTLARMQGRLRVGVIVGDLATDNDAQRLRETGAPVVQVTTGTMCHLDAGMVARAAGRLELKSLDLVLIENVGNLVCPASFDLGEATRVALLSVTEGEDKPLKYPPLFHSADVVVVTKMDLAEATGFARESALANIRRASPAAWVFELSARTGNGMGAWCDYLAEARRSVLPA